MVKKMKMAHKLMLLVGSVVVVAVVIVLAQQLKSSAQLAGTVYCCPGTTQNDCPADPTRCMTPSSLGSCPSGTIDCGTNGGGAVTKSCAGILGLLRFDRRVRLQPENQLRLDNLAKDTLKTTQQKVNEVMADAAVVEDIERVFQAQRTTDLANAQNELNGVSDLATREQIINKLYMAAVYIPTATSWKTLISAGKAIPLNDEDCGTQGGGGGGKCPVGDGTMCREMQICPEGETSACIGGVSQPCCAEGGGGGNVQCDCISDMLHLCAIDPYDGQCPCDASGTPSTEDPDCQGGGGGCQNDYICEKSCPNDRDCDWNLDPLGKMSNIGQTLIRSELTKYFDANVATTVTTAEAVVIENAINVTEQKVTNAVDNTYTADSIMNTIVTPATDAVVAAVSSITDTATQDVIINAVAKNAGLQVAAQVKNANANATLTEIQAAVTATETAVKTAGYSAKK